MLNARTRGGELEPLSADAAPGWTMPNASSSTTAAWLVLVVVAVALAVLLWVQRRRRRTTARYAALLAGSEPIPVVPDAFPLAMAPFTEHTASPLAIEREPSRVRPSGTNTAPPSERQWLSQPPPRSAKGPPV